MMMIPGTWEPRRRSGAADAAVEPLTSGPRPAADSPGGNGPESDTRRAEPPGWLKASVFGATLLAAMWLAMWAIF